MPLGHVRLHTSTEADAAARSIQARAFTHGAAIAFAAGQYQPETPDGARLLAHELVHVAQQRDGGTPRVIQRQATPGAATRQTITPQFAQHLDDATLQSEINAVREAMRTAVRDSLEYETLRDNLQTLEAEVGLRSLPGLNGLGQTTGSVPRPAGLPLSGGFMLQPVDLPPEMVERIPEGRLVNLPSSPASQVGSPGSRVSATSLVAPLSGPAYAANAAANASLMRNGFAAAGENSIGLVAIPRWTLGNAFRGRVPFIPESISIPGHTAMIVRANGELHVFGMAPASSTRAAVSYTRDLLGQPPGELPGAISDDAWLFTKRSARSVEWAVDAETAQTALNNARGAAAPNYTFRPNPASPGMNCGAWGCSQIESAVGEAVTTRGGTPLVDMPTPGATGQGQLMRTLGEGDLAPLGESGAVLGEMSTGLKVLKFGGRVFIVIAVAATVYDIATAKPEERGRTAARELTGFAAGFAAGALAGLACGPGAPVCSVLLGLGFGIAGTLIGRKVGEGVYDAATGRPSDNADVDECDRPPPPCPSCHRRVCPPRNRFPNFPMMGVPRVGSISDNDRALMEYIRSLTPPAPGTTTPQAGPR